MHNVCLCSPGWERWRSQRRQLMDFSTHKPTKCCLDLHKPKNTLKNVFSSVLQLYCVSEEQGWSINNTLPSGWREQLLILHYKLKNSSSDENDSPCVHMIEAVSWYIRSWEWMKMQMHPHSIITPLTIFLWDLMNPAAAGFIHWFTTGCGQQQWDFLSLRLTGRWHQHAPG